MTGAPKTTPERLADLSRSLRQLADYHTQQAKHGGAAWEHHARCETTALYADEVVDSLSSQLSDAKAEIERLREERDGWRAKDADDGRRIKLLLGRVRRALAADDGVDVEAAAISMRHDRDAHRERADGLAEELERLRDTASSYVRFDGDSLDEALRSTVPLTARLAERDARVRAEALKASHDPGCDVIGPGPDLGPTTKPCNCASRRLAAETRRADEAEAGREALRVAAEAVDRSAVRVPHDPRVSLVAADRIDALHTALALPPSAHLAALKASVRAEVVEELDIVEPLEAVLKALDEAEDSGLVPENWMGMSRDDLEDRLRSMKDGGER